MINHRIICVPLCGWISSSKSVQVTQVLDQRIEYGRRFLGKSIHFFAGKLDDIGSHPPWARPNVASLGLCFSSPSTWNADAFYMVLWVSDACDIPDLSGGFTKVMQVNSSTAWWAICWLVVTGTWTLFYHIYVYVYIYIYIGTNHPNLLSYFSDG